MAGISDLPFRLIAKRFGVGLVSSEMVSAMGLVRGAEKTLGYLRTDPLERPLSVQIFGSDPGVMGQAAGLVVEAGASIVDINMGCPVKKVVKTGAGAALLRDIKKAEGIVKAVRQACDVPLTIKIRAGWTKEEAIAGEYARMAEHSGADALILHARFANQGFSGKADWDIISRVKKSIEIPLIGNGDVFCASQALEMRRQTGCDGVMLGRGALGNPWIFKQIRDLENGQEPFEPKLKDRRDIIMEHFRLLVAHCGGSERRAARKMRGLLLWYTKGLPNSTGFRGTICRIKDIDSLVLNLDRYFAMLEREGGRD
jgi:nifR3 family TIM-barrel protein